VGGGSKNKKREQSFPPMVEKALKRPLTNLIEASFLNKNQKY
jgi:hypothetical protein